jgi:hypothetical protein
MAPVKTEYYPELRAVHYTHVLHRLNVRAYKLQPTLTPYPLYFLTRYKIIQMVNIFPVPINIS